MKLSDRVAWNALTTLVAEGLAVVLQFWLVRFLIDQLRLDYGLTTLVASFILYLLMVDLGLRRALTRQLAASIARGDPEQANRFFGTAVACLLSLAVVLAAACLVGAPWIIRLARVGPAQFDVAVSLTRWYVAPMIVLSLISPLYKSVLIALNRFDVVNWIRLAEMATRFVVIVGLLSLTRAGLYGWALGMGAGLAMELALSILASHWLLPYLRFRPSNFHAASLRDLGWLGLSSVVYENGLNLAITAHPLVIARFVGVAANVAYDPARQVVLGVDLLVGGVTRQVLPMAAHFHAKDDAGTLRDLLVRGTRFTLVLGGPCCVLLAVYAEPLLRTWQTAAFAPHVPAAVAALSFWCAINLVKYVGGTQYNVLFGMHKVWFISLLELVQSLFSLGASVVLTAWLAGWLGEVALIGVLIPTLVCSLLARAVNTAYVAHAVGVPLGEYLAWGYWLPLRALAALSVFGWGSVWLAPPDTFWRFMASGSLSAIAAAALCWCLAFDGRDRRLLGALVSRSWRGQPSAPSTTPSRWASAASEPDPIA